MAYKQAHSTLARIERRKQVAQRYLRGMSQQQIADDLQVNRSSIKRDLESIREEWKASAIRDFDAAKADELAKIDHLERTYWVEYERSLDPLTTEHGETSQVGIGKDGKTVTDRTRAGFRREERLGDPRYLRGIDRCIERRCKLLGLDAPVKTDVNARLTGDGSAPPVRVEYQIDPNSMAAVMGILSDVGGFDDLEEPETGATQAAP